MKKIKSDAKSFLSSLEYAKTIALSGHVQPDGDTIGSVLGLFSVLKKSGFEVFPLMLKNEIPESYRFLPFIDEILNPEKFKKKTDIFISVDSPTPDRLGPAVSAFNGAENTINIDHHIDNKSFAEINIVHTDISSVSEIIYWILSNSGFSLSPEEALCFYVGIVTDTGRFQYTNTSSDTFQAAKELIEKGVSPNFVFKKIYENISYSSTKLLSIMLNRAVVEDGLIWSYISREDLSKTGARLVDSENFVDFLRSVRGVKVAALIKEVKTERGKHWKVSLRSKGKINVQEIASKFGGGGHPQASGFKTETEPEEVINKIKEFTKIRKEE